MEDNLVVGKYRLIFEVVGFAYPISQILNFSKSLINVTMIVLQTKEFKVIQVYSVNNEIVFVIEVIKNPIPVPVVAGAILGAIGVIGLVLVFKSCEKIITESKPVAFSISILLVVAAIYFLIKIYKHNF